MTHTIEFLNDRMLNSIVGGMPNEMADGGISKARDKVPSNSPEGILKAREKGRLPSFLFD